MRIVKIENKQGKPRVCFCWVCGRKLYGNHFAEVLFSDDNVRILHKTCAKWLDLGDD